MQPTQELLPNIRFGTSSWNYRGWSGLVYHDTYRSEADFRRRSLVEYVKFPLFQTVGIDNSFYRPLASATLEQYAQQVPEGFLWASKVWEHITIPVFPKHSRYGKHAGSVNPQFLNPDYFIDSVLSPFSTESIQKHTGPFLFQFPAFGAEARSVIGDFFHRLQQFFSRLPRTFSYAVEIRSPDLLCADYISVLNDFAVSHVFNHWTDMSDLRTQMHQVAEFGGLRSNLLVMRLLTPLGIHYADAVKRFQPYDKVILPNMTMRADVVTFIRRALERRASCFILVNNRCEGCAPQTIEQIAHLAQDSLTRKPLLITN